MKETINLEYLNNILPVDEEIRDMELAQLEKIEKELKGGDIYE